MSVALASTNGKAAVLSNPNKPPAPTLDPSQIHDGLKMFDRFTGWNWVLKDGKWGKPPRDPKTGRAGSSTDPDKWSSFDIAIEAQRVGKVECIGFVLGEADGGICFSGIDLDDCRDPETGELSETAKEIIATMDTYTEVSPSGTGIKIFCIGSLPAGHKTENRAKTVEIYTSGRYFAITGRRIDGTPKRVEHRQEQLEAVWQKYIGSEQPAVAESQEKTPLPTRGVDASVLAEMQKSTKFREDGNDGSFRLNICVSRGIEANLSDAAIIATIRAYEVDRPFPAKWSDEQIVQKIRYAEPKVERGVKARKQVDFERLSSRELAKADYSLDYLIDNVLVAQQPLIIAGAQKTLKTSIIIDAAISLASGGFFLGKFKVQRACRVAVMTGESGLSTIQETASRICIAAKVWLDEQDNLVWSTSLPRFGDLDHLSALERFLVNDEIEVLAIDPAYLCLPSGDAGNLMAQGELLASVSQLCQQMGVTMILAHHTKKNTGRDPFDYPELADIAWSGFAEFARQWWLVGRRERYEPGTGEHRLWLSIGGSAGHGGLWALDIGEGTNQSPDGRHWAVDVMAASDAQSDAEERKDQSKKQQREERRETDAKALVDAMATLPDYQGTKTEIRAATGLNSTRFDPALALVIQRQEVASVEITKANNRVYPGYKLGESNV